MDKLYSMLGIGRKAGYVVVGETACINTIKKSKSYLVIISKDASENTKEKFTRICAKYNVDYIFFGEKEKLGRSVGKEVIATLAITNEGFSKSLFSHL